MELIKTQLTNMKKLTSSLSPADMWIPLIGLIGLTYFLRHNVVATILVGLNAILMMGLIQTVGGKLTNFNVLGFFLLQGPIYSFLVDLVPPTFPAIVLGAVSTAALVKILFREVKIMDSVLLGLLQEGIFFVFSLILAQGILNSFMSVIPV